MTYANLLVAVDDGPESSSRLELACDLANAFDAHLTGLCATRVEPQLYELSIGAAMVGELMAAYRDMALAELERARTDFEAIVKDRDVRAEWRGEMGSPGEIIVHAARAADLLVVGARNPRAPNRAPDVADVVMASGRPVLITPPTWMRSPVGEPALVAWKDCRESRLALVSALPLLQRARGVTVYKVRSADEGETRENELADIVNFLARHQIVAEIVIAARSELPVGRQILNEASARKAGLVVAGAYGHNRLRQWALGGVTRALIHDSAICLCLAH